MKKGSILDIPEDLLEDDRGMGIAKTHSIKPTTSINQSGERSSQMAIECLLTEVAQSLNIDPQELSEWMNDHSIPTEVLKTILRTAKRFTLNPLLGHIAWELNDKNCWEVYIPIDGWIELIHQEPTFQGISFDQATETEHGIPIWMECTIYCANLSHPITVREYYSELKTDHPMWTQRPRRMLRHKTLQQCARLAFGISIQEYEVLLQPAIKENLRSLGCCASPRNSKVLLRQKLKIS